MQQNTADITNLSDEWHPLKNEGKMLSDFTPGSNYSARWICRKTCPQGCLHEWSATIKNRCRSKNPSGCPYCSGQKICIHESIESTHPEIAAQWHPTKNGDKKPSEYKEGSAVTIYWLCSKTCAEGCPHLWKTTIRHRCQLKQGCPCCSHRQNTCIHTSIVTTYPGVAAQWHPTKNINKYPSEFLAGSNDIVWWQCSNTCSEGCLHEWKTSIANRCKSINPTNCPYYPCLERNPQKCCIHTSIVTTHPNIADEWDVEKNGDTIPSSYTRGSGYMAWWTCPKTHKSYPASIDHRCGRGDGCPSCTHKTEAKVMEYLNLRGIRYSRQYTWSELRYKNPLSFDIYLPDYAIIIEIDGETHFKDISGWNTNVVFDRNKDVFKMQQADIKGMKVIRIYQPDVWCNNFEWLDEYLLSSIKDSDRNHVFISSIDDKYDSHIALYEKGEPIILSNK